jgi:hypothetical protein
VGVLTITGRRTDDKVKYKAFFNQKRAKNIQIDSLFFSSLPCQESMQKHNSSGRLHFQTIRWNEKVR